MVLTAEIGRAQFILFGEDHGFADSALVLRAISKAARPQGFAYHAVETGPSTTGLVASALKRDGVDGVAKLVRAAPLAIPFLSMREDAELASEFVGAGADHLWGLDQEFVGAPALLLKRLAEIAPSDAARMEVSHRLAAERKAAERGAQKDFLLFSADDKAFDTLATMFKGVDEAQSIIAGLRESAAIYQAYMRGENYASNARRGALIAANFLKRFHEAGEPKAIFKMGADHLGLGTSPNNIVDVGTLASEIAAAHGRTALRILFLPLGGSHTVFAPKPGNPFATEAYDDADAKDFFAAIGVSKADLYAKGWTLIPLPPVREALETEKINALKPMTKFLLLGFDYVITTPDARPATPLY